MLRRYARQLGVAVLAGSLEAEVRRTLGFPQVQDANDDCLVAGGTVLGGPVLE